MVKFHNLKSFIKEGFKQRSTYIGIGAFIFYGYNHAIINKIITDVLIQIGKDLPILTHNILTSPSLVSSIVQGLGGVGATLLIIFRGKK